MQITCDRDQLREAIHTVQRAITTRTTLPILHNVLLEASDGSLTITATDLELIIRSVVVANIQEAGRTTVPVKYFSPMVDSLPLDEVTLSADSRDQMALKSGATSYTINGLSADEFPVLPTVESISEIALPQGLVREMIEHVVFAASADESRAVLTGVLMEIQPDVLRLVATDTHRLAVRQEPISVQVAEAKSAIIPAKAFREVHRLLEKDSEEPVTMSFSDNQVKCVMGDTVIMCRLLEGSFPNYEKVIPPDYEREVAVDKDLLASVVSRVMIVGRQSAGRVLFDIASDSMTVSARSQDVGEAREELPVQLVGEPMEIAINGEFLVDAMNAIDADQLVFRLNAPLSPAVITTERGENYTYVVMPMQPLR